ncbi:hypothetical protein [Tautonia sociabilis]|uniref:Uncharacterized protein n=1 Tax=Tautonia sociabilis TaxID=2080755 RepID=A0A432MDF5_9BACT|nr:hypothetical protein [Tautonia sociabilis]RUL82347.1 hypothetical protein TsocGM_23620 [Tautonia sociabilis]
MGRGRSFALWASCLIVLASGCAGPGRRAGLSGGAGLSAMPRLMRPADPIARLAPARISVDPVGAPGSYTPARPHLAGSRGVGIGRLTVGGGELAGREALASRSPTSTRTPTPTPTPGPRGERPSVAPESMAAGTPGPRGERAIGEGSPVVEVLDNGWPVVPGSSAAAGSGAAAIRLADSGEAAGSGPGPGLGLGPASASASGSASASEPAGVGAMTRGEAPRPEPESASESAPILAAGIDLETYAAPAMGADPEARQVSIRRPIALLSNVLATAMGEQRSAPEPRAEDGEADQGVASDDREPVAMEGGAEAFGPPALPSFPLPARDEVRPAVSDPEPEATEEAASFEDGRGGAAEESSPFEDDRGSFGVVSRLRQLGRRVVPGRLRGGSGEEPAPGLRRELPTLRQLGRRPLPRLGREDVGWLGPGA